LARTRDAWILDGFSLVCYFLLLPAAQVALVYKVYAVLLPALHGSLSIGWGFALLLIFAMDYVWYWNHRLFHARTPLWNLHAVHHEAKALDVLASQRNSLLSFPFMIYFWLPPLLIYCAKDPAPLLTLSGFAALINFWGHTHLDLPENSWARKFASLAIIQPQDHFWHHSAENSNCNFATLFNFWDKLHGTWHQPGIAPKALGFELRAPLWRKILIPDAS
ncbi:MAG: sterol desaturase family protein, partial [Bdellovibrionota bacterium]